MIHNLFNAYPLIRILTGIVISLAVVSCSSNKLPYKKQIVKYSCELNNYINDTVFVSGVYSKCMEYSSFRLIEKDSCSNEFGLELKYLKANISDELKDRLLNMDGCGLSIDLIVKGIIIKEKDKKYGHAVSNNAQLDVLEVIKYGNLKRKKY